MRHYIFICRKSCTQKTACVVTSGYLIGFLIMLLFVCFICLRITEQNKHIIVAAIQNTVYIDIFSIGPVEHNPICCKIQQQNLQHMASRYTKQK